MRTALYSVTYSGLWYEGPALTLEQVIERAHRHGFAGLEIDGKQPHGFGLDLDEARCRRVRSLADAQGVALVALAANNDFTSAVEEHREAQVVMVARLIDAASALGVPYLRLFAAWPGVTRVDGRATYDFTRNPNYRVPATQLQRWAWCRESIERLLPLAERRGVVLTLQNHKPLIDDYRDMLQMVTEIGSEHLRCTLDCHLLPQGDPALIERAVADTATLLSYCHVAGEYDWGDGGDVRQIELPGRDLIDYPTFLGALARVGFDGYLSYELCHPFLPGERRLGSLDQVDERVAAAKAYMEGALADAHRRRDGAGGT